MTDHPTPHFHNDMGVPVIEVGSKQFMCTGARPPHDHPHIYIDMGDETEIVCSYCSTLYRHNASLTPTEANPPEAAYEYDAGETPGIEKVMGLPPLTSPPSA